MGAINMVGRRSGRLVVLGDAPRAPRSGRLSRRLLCMCQCGKECLVFACNFSNGHTRSCGCLGADVRLAANTKHGHAARGRLSGELRAYWSMIARCTRPTNKFWCRYGGRGITVCERWMSSFENFLADMGPKPDVCHSLDRTDNDRGYEPDNCRWATAKEQQRNTSRNRWLEHNGERHTTAEWAEITGIDRRTILSRLSGGWSVDRAVTERVQRKSQKQERLDALLASCREAGE